jgi:hypothetical protein
MKNLDIRITRRSPQLCHDVKKWIIVDNSRVAASAMIIEAFQHVALTAVITLSISASGFAASGQSITFDAPNAGTAPNLGTFPGDINDLGQVIGYSIDEGGFFHGFVRYPEGRVKTIDAPGAGTVPGSGQGTIALAINDEGTIVGSTRTRISFTMLSCASRTAISSASRRLELAQRQAEEQKRPTSTPRVQLSA